MRLARRMLAQDDRQGNRPDTVEDGAKAIHFYLSGALGWMDIDVGDPFDPDANRSVRQPVRVLMAGITFEARLRGLSGGHPPQSFPGP
jgi:hypothetical protein